MTKLPTILVTGGAGFIGSHCCVSLINSGFAPVIYDSLVNSSAGVVSRIEDLTGFRPPLICADIRDKSSLQTVFDEQKISAVIHFAALKAVGDSVENPLEYYDVNVGGTISLLSVMKTAGVNTLVFSSSATVYGETKSLPIDEEVSRSARNPYGRSKIIVEDFLADLVESAPEWRVARLRYFNPFGAHESSLIGEAPQGPPNNVGPYITQVAAGRIPFLRIFGNDYPTRDGTGVRDFVHVVDLAEGHVAALRYLNQNPGLLTLNLGTGAGYSVLELVKTFEKVSGRPVPYQITPRRPGDVPAVYADVARATELLNWKARRSLEDMCRDSWRWQKNNPNGYDEP